MAVVANDIFVNSSLLLYGEYSGDEVALLRELCQPGDHVLDIGAHIGSITVALAPTVGSSGQIVSFEPQPDLFTALSHNVELRKLDNVRVVNAGAGARSDTLHVRRESGAMLFNQGASFLTESGDIPVDVITVDSLGLKPANLAKIDVEGMEMAVLEGATRTISTDTIVYFENSPFEHSSSLASSFAILSHFQQLGYKLYWHLPHFVSRRLISSSQPDVFADGGSFNVLALPSSYDRVDPHTLAENHGIIPIARPDELAFPLWLSPRLMSSSLYSGLREKGDAPLRDGDDPKRPWMVLYEAFLAYLDRGASGGRESDLSHTPAGWAVAELWFGSLVDRLGEDVSILTRDLPPAFEHFLRAVFKVSPVDEAKLKRVLAGGETDGSSIRSPAIVLVGADTLGALELDAVVTMSTELLESIGHIAAERRESPLPPGWRNGPDIAFALIEI